MALLIVSLLFFALCIPFGYAAATSTCADPRAVSTRLCRRGPHRDVAALVPGGVRRAHLHLLFTTPPCLRAPSSWAGTSLATLAAVLRLGDTDGRLWMGAAAPVLVWGPSPAAPLRLRRPSGRLLGVLVCCWFLVPDGAHPSRVGAATRAATSTSHRPYVWSRRSWCGQGVRRWAIAGVVAVAPRRADQRRRSSDPRRMASPGSHSTSRRTRGARSRARRRRPRLQADARRTPGRLTSDFSMRAPLLRHDAYRVSPLHNRRARRRVGAARSRRMVSAAAAGRGIVPAGAEGRRSRTWRRTPSTVSPPQELVLVAHIPGVQARCAESAPHSTRWPSARSAQ